ncbi:retrovirus-related pol polyprotein from transposon TNT 1-94 [Tanacetum coccineum]
MWSQGCNKFSGNLTKLNQKDQIVLEDSLENLANKSIVAEHGLSLEITQSPGESSDMSEGFKNSGSFKDSRRSDKEDSKDKAFSKEGGFKTLQVRRSTSQGSTKNPYSKKVINIEISSLEKNSFVRLLAGKKALHSKWVFKFKKEQDGNKSFMQKAWYKRCAMDRCCYLKKVGSFSIILLLYVDDMLVAGSDTAEITKLKRQLSQEFEMKDLGSAKQILGMSIIRDKTKGTLKLS